MRWFFVCCIAPAASIALEEAQSCLSSCLIHSLLVACDEETNPFSKLLLPSRPERACPHKAPTSGREIETWRIRLNSSTAPQHQHDYQETCCNGRPMLIDSFALLPKITTSKHPCLGVLVLLVLPPPRPEPSIGPTRQTTGA
jgi:hypothetical protein